MYTCETNDARLMLEIKSRIAMTKAALKKKGNFHQEIELKFKEESSELLHFEYSFVWCSDFDILKK
jgi:hypothetical protein